MTFGIHRAPHPKPFITSLKSGCVSLAFIGERPGLTSEGVIVGEHVLVSFHRWPPSEVDDPALIR